jgi:ABC-type nitrate/sulfonate/bicarbonate transport system substrate-binding protein
MGLGDITGFVCKKSYLQKNPEKIKSVIRAWFESVNYTFKDLNSHSKRVLEYLAKHAATKYTLSSFKEALSNEYFPKTIQEAQKEIIDDNGSYSHRNLYNTVTNYLIDRQLIKQKTPMPQFITVE